jgi:hypothetical protein
MHRILSLAKINVTFVVQFLTLPRNVSFMGRLFRLYPWPRRACHYAGRLHGLLVAATDDSIQKFRTMIEPLQHGVADEGRFSET